jgi:hypothetical protein
VARWPSALRARLYGERPSPQAPPLERLLYVRRIMIRLLLVYIVIYAVAGILIATAVTWAALGFVGLIQLFTIALISRSIRQQRSPTGLD